MTAWLAYVKNVSYETAAEEVRVAHALEELPRIAAAYEEGKLSWDQVRAVTRFATLETSRGHYRRPRADQGTRRHPVRDTRNRRKGG